MDGNCDRSGLGGRPNSPISEHPALTGHPLGANGHFVEMPAITRSRTAPPQSPSNRRSEFENPTANALVGDVEPTLGKQFLNIAIAQCEAQVEPHRVLHHGRRETVPAIGDRIHGLAAYGPSAAIAKLS